MADRPPDPAHPGGQQRLRPQRLADTVAFFEFMRVEMPVLVDRWRAFRQTRPAPSQTGQAAPER